MHNRILAFWANTFLILFIIIIFYSCDNDYQPKPRGYFRIQLPEKQYQLFEKENFPYTFLMPTYARVMPPKVQDEKYWINVVFPDFKAQIHISYKPIHHNLDTLLNDVHVMMNKHIPKANAINERMFLNPEKSVYGMAYEIKGSEAASPYQFYLTDSTAHFLRGALYFNYSPNNDSLKPIIDFLEEDIEKLIDSFEWK